MSDSAPGTRRYRPVAMVLLAFALGAAAGVLVTSSAASRAARATVRAARHLFVYDQAQRMALAWNAKNLEEAFAYARCAYEAEHAEGARWFDKASDVWSVWDYAFLQLAIVDPNKAIAEKARPVEEGMALARVAVALEALGHQQEAESWLARAVKAGGGGAERWRKLGRETIGQTLPEGFLHPDGTVRK